jgi:hypothetical protein
LLARPPRALKAYPLGRALLLELEVDQWQTRAGPHARASLLVGATPSALKAYPLGRALLLELEVDQWQTRAGPHARASLLVGAAPLGSRDNPPREGSCWSTRAISGKCSPPSGGSRFGATPSALAREGVSLWAGAAQLGHWRFPASGGRNRNRGLPDSIPT